MSLARRLPPGQRGWELWGLVFREERAPALRMVLSPLSICVSSLALCAQSPASQAVPFSQPAVSLHTYPSAVKERVTSACPGSDPSSATGGSRDPE